MNPLSQKRQSTLLTFLAVGFLAVNAPALSQVNPSDSITQEEYEVISVALGKRTERVFMDGLSTREIFTLRNALSAHRPAQTRQQHDPALTRPKRESTKYMKRENGRRQDEDAFKAEISEETVTDWMEKNSASYEWQDHFHLGAAVILLKRNLNEPSPAVDYWKQLRTKYPDLIATEEASRVGFNRSVTQAVVLVGYHTGHIGGEGQYILLEKTNGKWEIKRRLAAWLS